MKKIIIVGGGTAALTVACFLRKQIPSNVVSIYLIEYGRHVDDQIVEAAHPAIHNFHELIGLDEKRCVQYGHAAFGLGLRYHDWSFPGQYTLAFGDYGASLRGVSFSQIYAKARELGVTHHYDSYSLNAAAVQAERFGHPPQDPGSIYAKIKYGLHLHGDEYKELLKNDAIAAGVNVVSANRIAVNLHQDGAIHSVGLDTGVTIEGDLFFDCTGSERMLSGALQQDTTCEEFFTGIFDRCACGLRSVGISNTPVAELKVVPNGYVKITPLNNMEAIKYVYSSSHTADDIVLKDMERLGVTGVTLSTSAFYNRKSYWVKNCVAMGAAAYAFPETFFSSLHIARNSIVRFLDVFVNVAHMDICAEEYNRLSMLEFNLVKDFTELNFYFARHNFRYLSAYFDDKGLSESALHRLNLFTVMGRCPQDEPGLLTTGDWAAFFIGQGVFPKSYDVTLDAIGDKSILEFMEKLRSVFARAVLPMPMHKEYIAKVKEY